MARVSSIWFHRKVMRDVLAIFPSQRELFVFIVVDVKPRPDTMSLFRSTQFITYGSQSAGSLVFVPLIVGEYYFKVSYSCLCCMCLIL